MKHAALYMAFAWLIVSCRTGGERTAAPLASAENAAPTIETNMTSVNVEYETAAELPAQPADIIGGFLSWGSWQDDGFLADILLVDVPCD